MSEYKLEISGNVSLGDYSSIHDYMGIVGEEDKFTIRMAPESVNNSDIICTMLKEENFTIASKGGNDNGEIYITAFRNRQ